MSKHVAFLFNTRDVFAFIIKREDGRSVTVFASGLDTENALNKEKIPYQEIKTYPPVSVTMKHYQKAHRIALLFDPTIYASVRNFFLEVLRSSYLASTIIKKYRPAIIYVSDAINESLYRKYHAETFDLLPQAVIAFAKLHRIKLIRLRRDQQPGSFIKSLISQITSDLFQLYNAHHHSFPSNSGQTQQLIISASDYHLTNLKSFILKAAEKWSITVLGKADLKIIKTFGEKISFANVYQFISIPKYLIHLLRNVFTLTTSTFAAIPAGVERQLNPFEIELCLRCRPAFLFWRSILVPQGKLNTYAFGKLLKRVSPSVVIASNGIDNYNRVLLLTAQNAHIKDAVIIHHQITDDIDIVEERSGIESTLFIPSKKLATMFHKFPGKTDIVITGNPIMDEYYHLPNPKVIPFHSPLRILFLLCQEHLRFHGENREIVLEALLELKKYPKPISVVLRNHPQHPALLRHFHQKFPFPIIERNDTPLQKDLLENDMVITQITSAAVEAIILRKPLIYLNTHSVKNIRNFATSGAALGVYKLSRLIPAINSLLENPSQLSQKQEKFVSTYCGKIDGKASQRIIKILNTIDMKSNPKPIY